MPRTPALSKPEHEPPRWGPWAAAAVALAIALYSQWPGLRSSYVVNGDAAIHTAWMATFRHPELFPDDPISAYSRQYQGLGPSLLYRLAAPVVPPLLLGKALPLGLSAVAAYFLFLLGWRLAGAPGAVLAAAWWVTTPLYLHKMAGGHARAFALPLLAAFLWSLLRRRPVGLAVTTVLAAVLYPIVFPVVLATAGLAGWRLVRPTGAAPGRRLALRLPRAAVAGLAAGALLGSAYLLLDRLGAANAAHGPLVTRADMAGRPEFGPRGHYPILPVPAYPAAAADELRQATPLLPPPALAPGRRARERFEPLSWLLLATFAGLLVEGTRRRWLPPEIAALVVAGWLSYMAADLLLARLYLPERYAQYTLRLAAPLVGAAALGRGLARLGSRARAAAVVAAVAVMAWHLPDLSGVGLRDRSAMAPVAAFLATRPVDALVAAHPYDADDVLLFARRRVLVAFRSSQPLRPGWWEWVRERTDAFFDAYYAPSRQAVCGFLDHWGVDLLVVDREHFTDGYLARGKAVYFEPFRTRIRRLTEGGGPYFLASAPPEAVLFRTGSRYVASPRSLGCVTNSLSGPLPATEPAAGAEVAF